MATAVSGTLVANTAQNVTVEVIAFGGEAGFAVTNRTADGSGTIWVRRDGQPATLAGSNCHPVIGSRAFKNPAGSTSVTVSLFSDAATPFTVEAA